MNYIIGICDDEVLQIKVNGVYIKDISERNHYQITLKAFKDSEQLYSYLKHASLDILFLDIDLGCESGIDIAAKLSLNYPNIIIVFLTGHREFTNEAFDVEALGYVVKPIDEKKLERTLLKALTQAYGLKSKHTDACLIITEENIKKKIKQSDIYYIERLQSKSIIHTKERKYQVYEPITALCERLDKSFLRINQSEVIRKNDITKIEGFSAFLRNGREMTIGRTYKKSVLAEFHQK